MLFANPVFLIALTALGIPVIIHLYNFRRYKKIYFTNVRFIAEIKQESKNRSQLKHLLILLMRLLRKDHSTRVRPYKGCDRRQNMDISRRIDLQSQFPRLDVH